MAASCCARAQTRVTINREALKDYARKIARAEQKRPGEKREEHRLEIARLKKNIEDSKAALADHEAEHAGEVVSATA